MLLSRLAGVGNFCLARAIFFDRMHPLFPSHIFPNPSLHTLPSISLVDPFSFYRYFNFHNFTYLGIDVSTHDMTMPPQTVLNYHIFDLHNKAHPIRKNISRQNINQSHLTHHPRSYDALPHKMLVHPQ